jgi:hypothetical protein
LAPPPPPPEIRFDVVIMLNTYRGWEHAQLRENEKNLPELADKYFTQSARYTILTVTQKQIKHFYKLCFHVKILGCGERDSIMISITKENSFNQLNNIFSMVIILTHKIHKFFLKSMFFSGEFTRRIK